MLAASWEDNTLGWPKVTLADPSLRTPAAGAEGSTPNRGDDCGSAGTPDRVVAKLVTVPPCWAVDRADCSFTSV